MSHFQGKGALRLEGPNLTPRPWKPGYNSMSHFQGKGALRLEAGIAHKEGGRYSGGHPYFLEEQNHTHQNNLCSPPPKALGAPEQAYVAPAN
eukprot:5701139-Pyramimonas_sp.AAC.1